MPEPGVGGQVAGERQPQVEHPIVVARLALGRQQLLEEGLTPVGDAVHLLAPAAAGSAGLAGPEDGQLAAERPGHRDRTAAGLATASTALTAPARSRRPRAGYREPKETPLPKPERVGQPLLQLVAVQVLFLQQSQDGQFEHDVLQARLIAPSMYRFDISGECTQVNAVGVYAPTCPAALSTRAVGCGGTLSDELPARGAARRAASRRRRGRPRRLPVGPQPW